MKFDIKMYGAVRQCRKDGVEWVDKSTLTSLSKKYCERLARESNPMNPVIRIATFDLIER